MTTTTLPRSGSGRAQPRHYDWPAYAERLTRFPGQWLMLHDDADKRTITYARSGRQADLAPLHGFVEWRTRNTVEIAGSRRGELWARYTPGTPAHNGPTISDEQVRHMREDAANGATQAELVAKYHTAQTNVSYILRGVRRAKAGGPIAGVDYHRDTP